MDQIINYMNLKIQKYEARNETITTVIANQVDNCGSSLPITNEEEVIEFETKLLDKNFKTNVVNGLKRLTRKTLTSTVCQMIRKYLMMRYLKNIAMWARKKRIFFSLKTCTVIFKAV